jgi:predicted membrane-bound spermidine synthase
LLLFLFFLSGLSGLIYQVVWVRELGTAFGNTIHSASLVVAIFMIGLGCGGFLAGRWADKRYGAAPDSLLRIYGYTELLIAALGLGVSLILPVAGALAAQSSSYVIDQSGWFVLSTESYAARGAIALALIGPPSLLMGATLTLLVRHLVRRDVAAEGGWKIALLYGVNTAGAAAGAFLTDFALVPAVGLRATQFVAVGLNVVAGMGAIALSRRYVVSGFSRTRSGRNTGSSARPPEGGHYVRGAGAETVFWTGLALVLAGFAAMGLEILWVRHFTLLLGGFRSVFSLVLTIVLAGIGAGAYVGGSLGRRVASPERALMITQSLFVIVVLAGLSANSFDTISAARASRLPELWFNVRPMLLEIGLPALLMGVAFPLANAVVQHADPSVGSRAGILYLANTAGAVLGSLAAGYLLLPRFGVQGTATVLVFAAGLTLAPLYLASSTAGARGRMTATAIVALAVVGVTIDAWLRLPEHYLVERSLPAVLLPERLLAVRESLTETLAITEIPGRGRSLLTDGHAMSSTAPLDQRYMRALVHIPLLSMPAPRRVLVIGFGVGNSTQAATLYSSVQCVEVVDVSRRVLEHANYFRTANGDVLRNPRVHVFVNDGRQHLAMEPERSYDLITLEPPPIAQAGTGALYSREFYSLARTRLKAGGYISQWLPAYQVPPATSLAMARAFVDVFPQSVLLSGMQSELLLLGTTGDRLEIDPVMIARTLEREPEVLADLRRVDLGSVKEIVGTFLGSPETLARATLQSSPVSDDHPLQEYGVRSLLATGTSGVPASLVDLPAAAAWCPRCFNGDQSTPAAPGLDAYLALMDEAYHSPSRTKAGPPILGSSYLGAILPDTDAVHNIVGVTLLDERRYDEAEVEFREALRRRPDSPDANRNLGTVLAATGRTREAIEYLEKALTLAPGNDYARQELEETRHQR